MKSKKTDWNLYWKDRYQYFRESIVAPIVFKAMDILGIKLHLPFTHTGEAAQQLIYDKLMADKPCMIARIGATEVRVIEGILHQNDPWYRKLKWLIMGHQYRLSPKITKLWSGFTFYQPNEFFQPFTELMMHDLEEIDVLASWRWEETEVIPPDYQFPCVPLDGLEPFFSKNPWSRALAKKKVLVINPFDETIKKQYQKREQIFPGTDILPEFELITYRSFALGNRTEESLTDWFDMLQRMEDEISKIDFDIALLGCGPFGFPLAAYIKRMGKKAVILGGVLQILFGISGRRWDRNPKYLSLVNDAWCRPGAQERPAVFSRIEGGCYW